MGDENIIIIILIMRKNFNGHHGSKHHEIELGVEVIHHGYSWVLAAQFS